MELLTANEIATLAFTKFLEKTVENFTEKGLAIIDDLRHKIGNNFKKNREAKEAINAIEQGDKSQLERLAAYLKDAMDNNERFAAEVQNLAKSINAEKLEKNSSLIQKNYDSSTGVQTKVDSGEVFIGNNTIYKTSS
ncbi:hypothetical protein [Moorena sp. SIO3H5]|uniref:hypothetical protein n=1 Tax=Moorena sp. SIO3H5 TaxID=2607834 RepID=UPI0025CD7C2D|nr:hypothetical protein [Moorena sp. SIO3H5]